MRLFLYFILTAMAVPSFGQDISFDGPESLNKVIIDTTTNPACSWQIGKPNKSVFMSAHSPHNAIMTDTVNPVQANDTSIFYLTNKITSASMGVFVMNFWYQMDGDSTDYGILEISPDTGHTWINVLTDDLIYGILWTGSKSTLKGSTDGWQVLAMAIYDWPFHGEFGVEYLDTIILRFTYITDSNSTPHDGWIIDDVHFSFEFEGLDDLRIDRLVSIFPNPTSTQIFIQREAGSKEESIQIFDITGRVVYEDLRFKGESINVQNLTNGIYLLRYSDLGNYALKRFIVQR